MAGCWLIDAADFACIADMTREGIYAKFSRASEFDLFF